MAINRDFLGREYRLARPYEVTRVKIREFADAIGDPNPLYHDTAAAEAAGYLDIIAPPTFAIVVGMEGAGQAIADPELGLDFTRVVHGDQRFSYSRPLVAGDTLEAVTRISDIKTLGTNEVITLESAMTAAEGEHVVTATNTLVARGEAG